MAEQPNQPFTIVPNFSAFGNFQFTQNLFGTPTETKKTEDKSAEKEISQDLIDDIEKEDDSIQFTPVVHLEIVEQKEMEEEVLFNERGLCARYDTEEKTFKERGRGEVKILRHPKTGYSRVILLRDQVFKLACNHYILPNIKINKIPSNDKMIQYFVTKDLAREEEDKPMTLAFRFNSTENRDKFFDLFVEKQNE